MRIEKLKEALVELKEERKAVDAVIAAIEALVAYSDGRAEVVPQRSASASNGSEGYVDMAVGILKEFGSPIHIKELVEEIGTKKGQSVDRKSVEATFSKHIHSSDSPKLVKVGAGVYALPGAALLSGVRSIPHAR